MLAELAIRNFAIIESLDVQFENGLTVLTGETGAGKSIIIDAVQLVVGGRGSQKYIRHGAPKAEIQGLFQVDSIHHPVVQRLSEMGIELSDQELVLSRHLHQSGKNSCRINGHLVSIAQLREIGAQLIDIHGQHENQELMQERSHIHLLDQFAGERLLPSLTSYTETYKCYRKLQKKLQTSLQNEQQIAQHIDLYSFQLEELNQANLQIGEEALLLEERAQLQNYHRLFEHLQLAYDAISSDSKALDFVGSAMSNLEGLVEVDSTIQSEVDVVSSSFYALQDVSHQLKNRLDSLYYDPNRLDEIESRLALFQTLKRKYGATIEEVLGYQAEIEEKLDRLKNHDERLEEEQVRLLELEADLLVDAKELTTLRLQVATELQQAVEEQLAQLHMEKASFVVQIERRTGERFSETGIDQVVFYISTNIGEPIKPIVDVASGGELSRLMLALKTIFSKHQGVTSIIFDEVDTGVSGRVAQAIAEKIAMIAAHSQVLCISHLPQVASMADHHYFIRKRVEEERTVTLIENIVGPERIKELSRMLSGAETTVLTLQHAEELLSLARERKKLF